MPTEIISKILRRYSKTVDFSGAVRFRIVKLSGGGDRINIDAFTIGGTQDTCFYQCGSIVKNGSVTGFENLPT